MTHDELLDIIERHQNHYQPEASNNMAWDALRTIAELHKPIEGYEHLCSACWFGDGMMAYPCPTIQTIEKELK